LRPLLDTPLLVLEVDLQVTGASEIEAEGIQGFVAFVADEQTDVQVVAGRVKVVERAHFASNLQVFIFEEYVFGFETLLLEPAPEFGLRQVLLK